MKRAVKPLLLLLLTLTLGLAGAGIWITGTAAGTRWLLETVDSLLPGLDIELQGGSLAGGVKLHSLRYESLSVVVSIAELEARLRPIALLWGELAVDSAQAGSVVLQLIRSGSPPAESLPTVPMPVLLTAQRLSVPYFELITASGSSLVAAIDTSLHWRGTTLRAIDGMIDWGEVTIVTDLGIRLQGDYAVDTRLRVKAPSLPGPVSAKLSGSLAALAISGRMDGQLPLHFDGDVALLDPHLPLRLKARSLAPAVVVLGGETLSLEDAQLHLEGDLLALDGDLRGTLVNRRYGPTTFEAPIAWRNGRLRIDQAHWQSEYGSVRSVCDVELGAGRWRCAGNFTALSLAPWTNAFAAQVSAAFALEGEWGERATGMRVSLPAVRGSLAGQPLSGRVSLSSTDFKRWQIGELWLTAGGSRAELIGHAGPMLDLRGKLVIDQIGTWIQGARGAISGAVELRGDLARPSLTSWVRGQQLAYREFRVDGFSADARWDQAGDASPQLTVQARELYRGEVPLGRLALSASGSESQLKLGLQLDGTPDHRAVLSCSAEHAKDWRLRCRQFEGRWPVGDSPRDWSLTDPVTVERRSSGQLVVQPFCIATASARLCLGSQLVFDGELVHPVQVTLRDLPLSWWAGVLPDHVGLTSGSGVSGSLLLRRLRPLSAEFQAGLEGLRWVWRNEEGSYPARLEQLELRADLDHRRAKISAEAHSEALGKAQLELVVDDPAGSRGLLGTLTIDDLQLAAFRWLSPSIQQLEGNVDGVVKIGGIAAEPQLDGRLSLARGRFKAVPLPYALTAVEAVVDFDEREAAIRGNLQVNDGQARLQGRLRLPQADASWRLRADVDTDVIRFAVLEDSVAAGSARVEIEVQPGKMAVKGSLNIDQADIRVRSLPPNTVGISPDAELEGMGEQRKGWDVEADIAVHLGNRLHFRGLGADLWLTGQLRLRHSERFSKHMTGKVLVESGRYRAYGQELVIRKGEVVFTGPLKNPDLQLEAIRESRDRETVAGLRVSGTLQNPVGELFSEPPMSETDTAYFLLVGRKRPASGNSDVSAEGTLLNLGLAQTNQSAARFAERFGIKDFQISAGSTEAGLETRLSGYLVPNLYVSYGTVLQENTNTLTIQYFITPKIIIEAVSGFTTALDFIYSFSID